MKPSLNKSLTLLMIVSQIVLTGFVLQWLQSQYKNEKSELQKELSRQFEKSEQEVLDTLLENNLIAPILKNKNGFKISLQEEDTNIQAGQGKLKMFFNKKESGDSTELVTIITDTSCTSFNATSQLLRHAMPFSQVIITRTRPNRTANTVQH